MPPKRQMLANVYDERATPRLRQVGVFRVLTYNILAEIYATRQMYPYCPVWALGWPFRRELLQRELQSYNADIVCLQVCFQLRYFEGRSINAKQILGWYLKKTRESMGLEGKIDGCAFFYKLNRFIMKEQYAVEFNEIANDYLANAMNEFDMTYPTATRKQTGPLLCISNVHIFSNPKFPDVKLWQTMAMVKQIERVALSRHLPIILCGDFNSEPTSAVYELMTRNHVGMDHPDIQQLTDLFVSMDLEHHIGFGSAYASVFGAEPAYTNYPGHWSGVVDYVWYTPELLTPFAGLKVHPPEVLEAYAKTALPNCQYSSDHVPLCMDFSLKPAALMGNGRY
ncbi:hypothetical protein ATCC90586_003735 [Pythium insidiosum]|nr:hypothetical protein ATCC90586_003735 [Pythium insidiosum]